MFTAPLIVRLSPARIRHECSVEILTHLTFTWDSPIA